MKKTTNYINKKILLGIMMAVFMFVGTFIVSADKVSADCSITSTLRIGARGAEVQCLQNVVGAVPDGAFGPMTQAKVIAWQIGKGLTPDGVFGPMSRAAWINSITNNVYPAGCSSNIGYSSTTGLPCSGGVNLPAGCYPGNNFSVTTGLPCSGVVNLPNGCTSTQGYSPITGVKCDSGVINPNPNGPLQGGAGDINISSTSVDVESEVAEGKTEKVLAFRVEAQDSDVQLTNLRIIVENNNTANSNRRPDRYMSKISLLMGNKEIASFDPAVMTRDGDIYTRNITLDNAIVREGLSNRETFYVVFRALNSIDSNDMDADWGVGIENIRFIDGQGSSMTYGSKINITSGKPSNHGITFVDATQTGDVRLRISLGSNNPDEGSIQVNEFSTTNNVNLLEFRFEAQSTDMVIESIDVDLVSGTANLNKILADLKLMRGNTVLSDITSFNSSTSQTVTFDLYDELEIDEGESENLKIVARVLKQDGNFLSGETLRASVDKNGINAEDSNGNEIMNFTGGANGYNQTLFVNGANIVFVSSNSVSTNQNNTSRDYILVFDVTAIGENLEIDRSVFNNEGSNSQDLIDVDYVISGSGTNLSSASLSSNASLSGNVYTVYEGQTRRFTLTVNVTTDTTGQKRIVLSNVAGIVPTTIVESVSATVNA